MRPLSATEAITPAIDHTKALLRPFSLGLWFKLGLVAAVAELSGQFMFPPVGNLGHSNPSAPGIGAVAGGLTEAMIGIIIVAAVVGLIIGLALFYVGSRLQLVLIDLVATRTTIVGDAWRRTASKAWRWIGLKLVCFLVALVGIAAIAAAPIILFLRSMPAGGSQASAGFVGSFVLFIAGIFVLIFLLVGLNWFLRDFVLPVVLFEDLSFGDSLRRAWHIVANEPGACFFYLFMKFVVSIAAGIIVEFCILAVAIVAAIPTGMIGYLLWALLHNSGPGGVLTMYVGLGLVGLIFVAAFLVAAISLGGAVLIFYQAYALYFIGGRIPRVGVMLQPPPPYYPPPAPALL